MRKIGFIAVLVLIILIALIAFNVSSKSSNLQSPNQAMENLKTDYAPQEQNGKEIEVTVTPIQFEKGIPIKFKVTISTHTIDLDYDIRQLSKLKDDKGNSYNARFWDGGKGGHHLSGELTFDNLQDVVKQLQLTIENINGLDRQFKWSLKE